MEIWNLQDVTVDFLEVPKSGEAQKKVKVTELFALPQTTQLHDKLTSGLKSTCLKTRPAREMLRQIIDNSNL